MTFTKYAAFLPGKIEQWIFIVDGLDVSVFDVPWQAIIEIGRDSTLNHKHLARTMHVINLNWTLLKGVRFLHKFCDPF